MANVLRVDKKAPPEGGVYVIAVYSSDVAEDLKKLGFRFYDKFHAPLSEACWMKAFSPGKVMPDFVKFVMSQNVNVRFLALGKEFAE